MGKIVLITGCSRGLGVLLAQDLSAKGYAVYAGVRQIEAVPTSQRSETSPGVHRIRLDVTSDVSCQEAVEQILSREGQIDVLINNAAISLSGPASSFTPSDYLSLLDTNTVGAFRLIRLVIPHMRSRRSGAIINITSMSGRVALPNFGLYSSSKFALEALGLSLRYELDSAGVSVTNIAPGAIRRQEAVSRSEVGHVSARQKFWLIRKLMPLLPPSEVVTVIGQVLENSHPPAQILIGRDAKITTFLQRLLPQFIWEKVMLLVWNR